MSEQNETPTAAEIARHYSAAMDSVNLLNAGKPVNMENDKWAGIVDRNKEHLRIILAKPWWTNEDLTPLQAAAQ